MDGDDGEGFEEWDADFLDQVIGVEEQALASSSAASQHPPPQPSSVLSSSYHLPSQPRQCRLYGASPSPSPSLPPPPQPPPISYSPPRELSQRLVDSHKPPSSHHPPNGHPPPPPPSRATPSTEELEIERLKKQLGRVSKQLASREQECAQLKKEREKREEQLKSASSRTERIESVDCGPKDISRGSRGVNDAKVQTTSQDNQAGKAVGIQTEKDVEATDLLQSDEQHAHQNLSVKLQSIWDPQVDQTVGSGLVSKLFVICYGLIGRNGTDVSSKIKLDAVVDGSLNYLGCPSHPLPLTASDAHKMSRFHSILVQVSSGMAPFEALLKPLVDLCALDDVNILHRAICLLHLILKHLFSMERKPEPRDNVKIEGPLPGDGITGVHGADGAKPEPPPSLNFDDTYMIPDTSLGFRSSVAGFRFWNGQRSSHRILKSLSVDSTTLFELMHQIIKKNKEEALRLEAVCIMNLILLRSSAYKEREKFGLQMVFESISELLKRECGSRLQKQALDLLFLLLNCPQILDKFCSNSKDRDHPWSVNIILQGLAGCIGSHGSAIEDLRLRRKVIVLLALLASSVTAGFEILTNHELPNGANFLMLILQALLSELDVEATGSPRSPGIPKERTLIMREGLILLNRLVSNPAYASTCLRLLTNSRDMVSLTIDVANRMSQKNSRLAKVESESGQAREFEVVDLARTFKRRVYSYLGDDIG